MERKSIWEDLSAEEIIEQMYLHTDADGTLYMQSFFLTGLDGDERSLRCKLHWGSDGYEKALNGYRALRGQLERLAAMADRLSDTEAENASILDSTLLSVWRTYLRPFETDGYDSEQMHDISDRLDTVEFVRRLARDLADGKELTAEETEYLRDYMGEGVSDDEVKLYDDYCDAIFADCRRRIGDKPHAYHEIIYAKRLCKLFELHAPKIILDNEGRALAIAFVLHRFCSETEPVDNAVRVYYDRLEQMTDELSDEYFRPQRMNSRKSLVPLFVYLILKENTDAEHHLKQQEILDILREYPYEVHLERKALSRIIHNLADSQLHICTDPKTGTWFVSDPH